MLHYPIIISYIVTEMVPFCLLQITVKWILFNFKSMLLDKNGQFDPGELPIPGAIVLLYPANNPTGPHIRVDTTDANGMYLFDNLTLGNYIVRFIPPPGFASPQLDI